MAFYLYLNEMKCQAEVLQQLLTEERGKKNVQNMNHMDLNTLWGAFVDVISWNMNENEWKGRARRNAKKMV